MDTPQIPRLIYLIFPRVVALIEIALVCAFAKVFGTTEAIVTAILILAVHRRTTLIQMLKAVISWHSRLQLAILFTGIIWIWILLFTQLFSPLGIPRPDYSSFSEIHDNPSALFFILLRVWTVVAFGEEVLGRVFLIDRFEAVLKGLFGGRTLAILLASVLFGAAHLYMGLGGVLLAGTVGLILSILYIQQKKSIWTNVIVHGMVDTIAMLLVFFGVTFV
jgi:membrane protease YdiL (CAAX protease family)